MTTQQEPQTSGPQAQEQQELRDTVNRVQGTVEQMNERLGEMNLRIDRVHSDISGFRNAVLAGFIASWVGGIAAFITLVMLLVLR